ncbi:MAG: lipopolysaccharide biosynthesis protein [Steroidobacteraceae bacterium]
MGIYTRKSARRSLLDTATFRALSQISTMLGYVLMVRGMSEQDFGVFNLLYAFIPVVGTISSFGLEQTLRRYQPEYLSSGNNAGAAWLVRFVGSARFVINIGVIAIVLLAWNLIAPLFKLTPYRVDFVVFCVLMLFFFQSRVLQITLAAHMLHRFSVGSTLVMSLAKLATYAALFWTNRFTLRNAIYAEIAAAVLSYACLKWAHFRYCRLQQPLQEQRPAPEDRKRMLRYAFFNQFNDAGTFLLSTRGDNLFVAALMNPIAVGTYSFYVRLNQMVRHILPMNLFDNVIQPLFFAIPPGEAEKRLPRYFSLLINTNLLLLLPITAYAALYHADIVTVVFGGKFVESSWLLPLIVLFTTVNIIATPVTLVAQYAERASIILLSKVFVIYNAIALLVLIPILGVFGAAIAHGTAQLAKNLFIWWFVRKTARWTNFGGVVVSSLLVWGSVLAAGYGLKATLEMPVVLHMAIGAILCTAGWLIYVRSPVLSRSDRDILANVLRGREARLLQWLRVFPERQRARRQE